MNWLSSPATKAPPRRRSPAFRFALRELRAGLKGFWIFIACLVLGVGTIASVSSLTSSIRDGLAREGQVILGGDVEINTRPAPLSDDLIQTFGDFGTVSKSARLRTMARTTPAPKIASVTNSTTPADTGRATLVELRAVDAYYPLYGTLETDPILPHTDLFDLKDRDGTPHWGAVIDPLAAERLGISVGDMLTLGTLRVEVRAYLTQEPDKANLGFQLGPSVLVRTEALDASGLIVTGSQLDHTYKIKLKDDLTPQDVHTYINDVHKNEKWRVRDRSTSAPGLRRFIDQMGSFLVIVGLAALIVGGVGVGGAVKGYMDRKTKTIATLKILGASGRTIFLTYFYQIMLIGLGATLVGLVLGAYIPALLAGLLPDNIPIDVTVGLYPLALILAAFYGLMITVAFTVWPLGRARDLPAVRLFRPLTAADRRRPRKSYMFVAALSALAVIVTAVLLSSSPLLAGGFLVGAVVSLLILRGVSLLIEKTARRLPRSKRPMVRMAIANLHRPGSALGSVVISMGLGLTLLATLTLIEGNLSSQIREDVPSEAPSFFMVDIQRGQADDFRRTAEAIDGVSDVSMVPSLRGTILEINGTPTKDWEVVDPSFGWILRGDRGLSFGRDPGKNNTLTDGTWWPDDYNGPPEISFGKEEAAGLGLKVGDMLTLNVLGRTLQARISSLRQINWESFGFNFVMLFDPNTLSGAPYTHMATLKASGTAEEEAHARLTGQFPNVTAIRMKEVLGRVASLLDQISAAVEGTALIAILAGILVLAGAIAAGFRERVYDSVILKVVGAVRSQVLKAYVFEFFMIGLTVALAALFLSFTASYLVIVYVMELNFTFLALPVLLTLLISLIATCLFGGIASFRALSVKPNQVLRNE